MEPTQLRRKEDRLAYIRETWSPNATWEDVHDYANMFGIGLNTMQMYLKELRLTYLTKVDLARLSREKYLKDVWAKEPYETRDSIQKVASILKSNSAIIAEDIRRLGLEDKKVPAGEQASRTMGERRENEYRGRQKEYKKYWDRYRKMGIKVTYVDLALDLNLELGRVMHEIQRLNITEMIKELRPTSEFSNHEKRVAYYKHNVDYFKNKPNLLKEAKKLGISPSQIQRELVFYGVLPREKEITTLDNSIDDDVYGKMYYSNSHSDYSDGCGNNSMSYEELNSVLGVGAGTYSADNWGKYGY